MAAVIGSDQWWANHQKRQVEQRQQRADEFLKSGDEIPDLDMWPDCSICDGTFSPL